MTDTMTTAPATVEVAPIEAPPRPAMIGAVLQCKIESADDGAQGA